MRCSKLVPMTMFGFVAVCWVSVASALNLPAVIGNNMVLQQGQPVPIWGWADKGEDVTVTLAGQTATTKTSDNGRWQVVLKELKPGNPLEMTVKSSSGKTIVVKNILVGEVWVCCGQSNMVIGVDECNDAKEEVAA